MWILFVGGPPCVGKSSSIDLILRDAELLGPFILCDADRFRSHTDPSSEAVSLALKSIAMKQNVVYVGTCASRRIVQTLFDAAQGYTTIFSTLYSPLDVCLQRAALRTLQAVPADVVQERYAYFSKQFPTLLLHPWTLVLLYDNVDTPRLVGKRTRRGALALLDCELIPFYVSLLH